jgi:hypothetical protein
LFGTVSVVEQSYRRRADGVQVRPFSVRAGMQSRGYSLPLQRALSDFGADNAFGQVPQKMREHYGIEVSASAARTITEAHGAEMAAQQQAALEAELGPEPGWEWVLAEADGCMLPLVKPSATSTDKRKEKTLGWEEARLCLARPVGTVTARYAATLLGTVDEVGAQWLDCAVRAGAGTQTQLHCVGDGAPWIARQVDAQFGAQGQYLLDFYHVSEYLSAAAKSCANDPKAWRQTQQTALKENRGADVLAALVPYREPASVPDLEAPVRVCERYLNNHLAYLDYAGALARELPIGSGEIESSHRYVIQARLKRPGAWWRAENAEKMLALRTQRANQEWDAYWQKLCQAPTENFVPD